MISVDLGDKSPGVAPGPIGEGDACGGKESKVSNISEFSETDQQQANQCSDNLQSLTSPLSMATIDSGRWNVNFFLSVRFILNIYKME